MTKKYIYYHKKATPELNAMVAAITFSTKKDTAEHYDFYLYYPEHNTWRVPKNSGDDRWDDIIEGLLAKGIIIEG